MRSSRDQGNHALEDQPWLPADAPNPWALLTFGAAVFTAALLAGCVLAPPMLFTGRKVLVMVVCTCVVGVAAFSQRRFRWPTRALASAGFGWLIVTGLWFGRAGEWTMHLVDWQLPWIGPIAFPIAWALVGAGLFVAAAESHDDHLATNLLVLFGFGAAIVTATTAGPWILHAWVNEPALRARAVDEPFTHLGHGSPAGAGASYIWYEASSSSTDETFDIPGFKLSCRHLYGPMHRCDLDPTGDDG